MKSRVAIFAAVLLALAALPALATPIGPNTGAPALTTTISTYGVDPFSTEAAALIGTSTNPVPISYGGATAGSWLKQLQGLVLDPTDELNLVEYVRVDPQQDWTDWHEVIKAQNIGWSQDADDSWYSLDGGTTKIYTGYTYNGQDLELVFQTPVAPGTLVIFHKELINLGSSQFSGEIDVNQYPSVPEPATLSLLALGGLAMLRRRKHARAR